jgi:hypothetical protein
MQQSDLEMLNRINQIQLQRIFEITSQPFRPGLIALLSMFFGATLFGAVVFCFSRFI